MITPLVSSDSSNNIKSKNKIMKIYNSERKPKSIIDQHVFVIYCSVLSVRVQLHIKLYFCNLHSEIYYSFEKLCLWSFCTNLTEHDTSYWKNIAQYGICTSINKTKHLRNKGAFLVWSYTAFIVESIVLFLNFV